MMRLKVIAILALFLIGCAKEREDQITQSASHNLESINDYQGKEFNLNVLGPMGGSIDTSTKALNADMRENGKVLASQLLNMNQIAPTSEISPSWQRCLRAKNQL